MYRSYVYEPGTFKPMALLKGHGTTNEVYYYQLDHLGTPQELTDAGGKIVWSAYYRAYGNVIKFDISEISNPLRFKGQYYDEESGLHYNRHRYYNPNTGRYLTPDPIKLAGGLNSYQYVPNPTGWVDPLGLMSVEGDCPGERGVVINPRKFDYLFGRVTSNAHNAARSNQLALEMKRLGVPDNAEGHQMLIHHLTLSTKTNGNVLENFSNQHGIFEVRESFFIGPSGKAANFQSTFLVLKNGTRKLSTIIPRH